MRELPPARAGALFAIFVWIVILFAGWAPSASAATGDEIIDLGDNFLKVPYKFGASPSQAPRAMDCSSFTQYVFGRFGIRLKRASYQQATQGKYVPKSDLQPGDLLFFHVSSATGARDKIGHVGIYAGDNKILHTYGKPGVTVTGLFGTSWGKRLVTARRMPGVTQAPEGSGSSRSGGTQASTRPGRSGSGGTAARGGSSRSGGRTAARSGGGRSTARGGSGGRRTTVRVNARYLNVRAGGSMNSRIIGHVRAGTRVTQTGTSSNGNWRHVQVGGRSAWIAAGPRWSAVVRR